MALQINQISREQTPYGRKVARYYCNDWTTEAFYFSDRNVLDTSDTFDKLNINENSIYFLFGENNNSFKVYVGRASEDEKHTSAIRRVKQHHTSQSDWYDSLWNEVVIFKFKNITFDEMRWLEDYCYNNIKSDIKLNKSNPDHSSYTKDKIKDKIRYIKEYLKEIMGTDIFKQDLEIDTAIRIENDIKMSFSEEEKSKEGKRLVSKEDETVTEVVTPSHIVEQMLDLLPKEIWNPNTRFLDIACKNGEFLKAIYNRLIESPLYTDAKFSNNAVKIMHIVNNQLYGIALSNESYNSTLKNFDNRNNIIKIKQSLFIPDKKIYNTKEKQDIYRKELAKTLNRAFNLEEDMQFDVVIGNPPYQSRDGKSSIYPYFIELGMQMGDKVCLITRDNWLNGKDFEKLRNSMKEHGQVSTIKHYPVVGDIFDLGVAVASFLWNKGKTGETTYVQIINNQIKLSRPVDIDCIIKSDIAASIYSKVGHKGEWTSKFNTRSYPFMDQRKRLERLDISSEKNVLYNVAVMANGEATVFTRLDEFQNIDDVLGYKVLCGVKINEAYDDRPGNVLTNIKAIGPYTVASETWSLIATFDNEKETVNCKKYIKTRLVRFMTNLTVNVKSTVTDNTFKFVPLQDFTQSSDIDWSQSITNIDEQLFAKYNLTEEEINYIKQTIKSLDTQTQPPQQIAQTPVTKEILAANYINSKLNQ